MLRCVFWFLLAVILVILPACYAEENAGEARSFSVKEVILERDGLKIWGEIYLPDADTPLPSSTCFVMEP